METLEEISSSCNDKENEIRIERILKDRMKAFAKINSSAEVRRLGSLSLSCLSLGSLSKKNYRNSRKADTETQNASEIENKNLSRKLLIGIEVYMPIVDAENNKLISPKFDGPIFKYREIVKDKQPLKISDVVNKNSNVHTIKKINKFVATSKDENLLKTSDMIDENFNVNINRKRSEFSMAIKDVVKTISKKSQKFQSQKSKSFKDEISDSKNSIVHPENEIFSKKEWTNTGISTETNKNRFLASVNSVKNKSPALKSPLNKAKSNQETGNIKQKHSKNDFRNPSNAKSSLKSPRDIEFNLQNAISIRPMPIINCRTSPASSDHKYSSEASPQVIFSQPFELCSVVAKTRSETTTTKYKSHSFEKMQNKTIHKHKEPSINEVDLTNLKDRNGVAEITDQKLMGNTKTGFKRSTSSHRLREENVFRRHLPRKVNTDHSNHETAMSNCCRHLPRDQSLILKREIDHHSRSTAIQINESRTTILREGRSYHKRIVPNAAKRFAVRRRVLQLMKSG